jgi:hypothetical protein
VLCCCVDVLMCSCVGVGTLVGWCVEGLMCRCVGVLVCSCSGAFVC